MKFVTAIYSTALFTALSITGLASLFFIHQVDPIQEIIDAFGQGDSQTIANYCAKEVDIIIAQEMSMHEKAQVETVLNDFFATHSPIEFTELHRGQSANQQGKFIIGHLKTKDLLFRTKILLSRDKILEINFEPEKQFT